MPTTAGSALTLASEEFLRRFVQHVLPRGFPRIRYFGFLANRRRARTLPLCRALLHQAPPQETPHDDREVIIVTSRLSIGVQSSGPTRRCTGQVCRSSDFATGREQTSPVTLKTKVNYPSGSQPAGPSTPFSVFDSWRAIRTPVFADSKVAPHCRTPTPRFRSLGIR
jgi:hypothetical protein